MALYLVGSVVVLALAGCGRSWLAAEREPWRGEAELACIKAGNVKQNDLIAQIKAIEGPGVCGAEYPFKVAALGTASLLGYAEDLRPPGAIPRSFPVPEPRQVLRAPMPPSYEPSVPAPARAYGPPAAASVAPMPIHPPGTDPDEDDTADLDPPTVGPYGTPLPPRPDVGRPVQPYPTAQSYPPVQAYPPAQSYPQAQPQYQQAQPQYRAPAARSPENESSDPPPLGRNRGPAMSFAGSTATVQPAATLACPMVSALDAWMLSAVQPSAQRWFGQPVAEIKQISAYSCRGMNGQRGAPISEHAFGNALDIAAFTLADGRKVTVKDGWRGAPEEQGFLRDVHAAACEQFSTVLAPGSNAFHYDHIHVDLARRASGRSVCNPSAVPGDVIAQRARGRYAAGGGRMGFAPEQQGSAAFDAMLPRAVPGAD